MANKGGIVYVKMTNPEAHCDPVGMGVGRNENIVTVGWKTNAATPYRVRSNGICAVFAASQAARHGEFAVAPSKFRGRLKYMQIVYPHGPTATPGSGYALRLYRGVNATPGSHDLAASAFDGVLITEASAKGFEMANFNPPLNVDWDMSFYVTHTDATGPGYRRAGAFKMYFE